MTSPIQRAGRFVLLLWGAPAAGKTTIARGVVRHLQNERGLVLPHLSTDQLNRAVIGEHFVPSLRRALYEGLLTMADQILSDGGCVLLDGTFLGLSIREQARQLALRRRCAVLSVQVGCSLPSRLARNALRGPSEQVPEEWIRRAHYQALAGRGYADLVLDTDRSRAADCRDRVLAVLNWRLEQGGRYPELVRREGKAFCAGL